MDPCMEAAINEAEIGLMEGGIPKVVIGENRTFLGQEEWLSSHGLQLEILQDTRCIEMMSRFIRERPELWNEDIGI
jgi:cytosine/creatinine deaminase